MLGVTLNGNFRRKKLHKTHQGSNSLGCKFSKNPNVRAQIQFRREREPEQLTR